MRKHHRSRATIFIRATPQISYLLVVIERARESLCCAPPGKGYLLLKSHSFHVQLRIHMCNIGTNNIRYCSRLKWESLSSKKPPNTGRTPEERTLRSWIPSEPTSFLPADPLQKPNSLSACQSDTTPGPSNHACSAFPQMDIIFQNGVWKMIFFFCHDNIPTIRGGGKAGTDILQGHSSFCPV